MFVLLFLLPVHIVAVTVFFLRFVTGGRIPTNGFFRITEILGMIVLPFLYANFGKENICCADDEIDTATFSPNHQLTVGVIILLALAGYFYSSYRKKIATPIVETFVNILVLIGLVLNIFIAFNTGEKSYVLVGNMPVLFLCILALAKNHRLFLAHAAEQGFADGIVKRWAYKLLTLKPLLKFPLLLIVCLPVLMVVICFLLLFGQKPDSIIRAFTDTYKHGFSQWDYQCDNVQCGGHYLCSVAANGHKKVVKPTRLGTRNGAYIVCNRQLLVANAFEELIQKNLPSLHRIIRRRYDAVGDLVHRYYFVFENKTVSDAVYFLMKPLEWFFLAVLYTFDRKPENRIAKQYLHNAAREAIDR